MHANDDFKLSASGHILIRDITNPDDPKVILDKQNLIHKGNFIKHLALAMAGKDNGNIHWMVFGNGSGSPEGSDVPDTGLNLNSTIHSIVISEYNNLTDNMTVGNFSASVADIVCLATLSGRVGGGDNFIFSELGLMSMASNDPDELGTIASPNGILLTHATFGDVTKARTDTFEIVYTIRLEAQ